jgi:predicted Zn-dependent protease
MVGIRSYTIKRTKYTEAIKFFKKASEINPNSTIIHFYLASAYIQNRDMNSALKYLQLAEKKDNKNPVVKYQLSNIYVNKDE